jgi:protein subunit release factor B
MPKPRTSSSASEWKVPEIIPIPEEALDISFVRSSGAGGQNVNKLNTKVELRFHVDSASWIPSEVRDRLKTNESNRINNEGYFSLTCQEYRTQVQNRKEALNKLREILKESWKRPKVRKMRQGLSKKTKENRMEMKRRNAEKKATRGRVDF